MYEYLSKPNASLDLTRTAFYRPLQRRFADVQPADLKELLVQVLEELKVLIGEKQFSLTDNRNLWIIKPGAQSRGRGIEIHSDIDEMMSRIRKSGLGCWVVQKYIERPLIILGKKFDIHVWVVITSV